MNNENNNAAFGTAVNSSIVPMIDYTQFLEGSMKISKISRDNAVLDFDGDERQQLVNRWMWLHSVRASGPRQSGKTRSIVEMVWPGDIVVVLNDIRKGEMIERLKARNPYLTDRVQIYTPSELVKCKRDPLIEGAFENKVSHQVFIDDSTYLQYNFQLKDVLKGLASKLETYSIDLYLIG